MIQRVWYPFLIIDLLRTYNSIIEAISDNVSMRGAGNVSRKLSWAFIYAQILTMAWRPTFSAEIEEIDVPI